MRQTTLNASRTMMFDIHKLDWDQKILDYFRFQRTCCQKIKPSSGIFGYTEVGMFGESIPIAGAAGDQQSALFSQCCFDAGEVKNTYGTGCFLLMNTGEKAVTSENGLLTTIAASSRRNRPVCIRRKYFLWQGGDPVAA